MRKVSGIEGKVDRVNNIFNSFEFPFIQSFLRSLGGSDAVPEGAIKYDQLEKTIKNVKSLCSKNGFTYSYFSDSGSRFKTFDDVSEAVSKANKGGDFQHKSGVRPQFAEKIKEQLERDSAFENTVDSCLDENFTDTFASAFEALNGFQRRDYQIDGLRFLWTLCIDDGFNPLIIQMLVGTGKNFMQAYLGLAIK